MSESTEEQHINGLSLPAQKKALTEYAEKNGCYIVDYYADEGISARKPMKYRSGLLRLLEDVKQDKIDMILVTKLDRWFRNIKDYNITEEILQAHHCHWKTIFEHYDSSTANGQMVINIMLSVNQAECDRTSERIRAVLDYKRSIGEVTSGRCACYGYRVIGNRLVKDGNAAPIIEDAYAHYQSCYSIRSTIHYIQDKYGKAAPSACKIERLFRNETYAGKDRENLHYCEPYISLQQFMRFQEIRSARNYGGDSVPYLFSSLIKCPCCGGNYTGYRKKQKRKCGGESIYYKYRCGNKYNRHSCIHLTEHLVEEYLLQHIFSDSALETITISWKKAQEKPIDKTASIRKEQERLTLLFQKGRITEEYFDAQYQILENKLFSNKKKNKENDINVDYDKYVNSLSTHTFYGTWKMLYQQLDRAHKQSFWKGLLRDICINQASRRICGFHFHT